MLQAHPALVEATRPGFYAVSCYDPFVEKIFLDRIPRRRGEWVTVSGRGMAADWAEVHLRELDLFSGARSFVILEADGMIQTAWEALVEEVGAGLESNFVVAFFSANSKRFSALAKKEANTALKIEAPRFWEGPQLLQFLCRTQGLALAPQAEQQLLDRLPHQAGELKCALNLLALHFPGGEPLSAQQVASVIGPRHLDHFKVADLLGERQWRAFFEALLTTECDLEALRSFFAFMQTHLGKLLDPSYLQNKPRPNQYDKKILAQSRRFKREELLRSLRFFGRMEILAKQKSARVRDILRRRWAGLCHPC